ncbi:MAG: HEAT repeat domain-containing protein [Parachlamydiaceae bacterium]|nr:HEAT repeat domain-containing protein [Parachlamydiaceae bacterium]
MTTIISLKPSLIAGVFLFLILSLSIEVTCYEGSAQKPSCPKQALFLIHKGQVDAALDLYCKHFQNADHDTEFLQQLGLSLLEHGARSSDPDVQRMAIFGAGIAMNERALPILAKGINSSIPQLQLLSLNFLARCQHDEADIYLQQALRSNYLIIRLEALHQLAIKKSPRASCQIESLMGKVDNELLPLFPQLFALVDDAEAFRMLRKLLNHPQEAVRLEAVISCARCGRDDLLSKIRNLGIHSSDAQQEVCALALGILNDEASAERLYQISLTALSPVVRLAALKSLYAMGRSFALERIKELACQGDLYAINLLGDIAGTEETLSRLLQSSDFTIRTNATLAQLKLQDVRCLPTLQEILIKDSRDLVFVKSTSRGKGFYYWKPVPSGRQQFDESSIELEISLSLRESVLAEAANLPEKHFLEICALIFNKQQTDLIPSAIDLLEKLQSSQAIELLKRYQQCPGAPLVRNYCNLALFRLGEEGPYVDNLSNWVKQQASEDFIQLRPLIPWELDDEKSTYQITPHETSRLLIETFEALTKKQDNNGINVLLEAIRHGNSKNKYALAGLLIRATL